MKPGTIQLNGLVFGPPLIYMAGQENPELNGSFLLAKWSIDGGFPIGMFDYQRVLAVRNAMNPVKICKNDTH